MKGQKKKKKINSGDVTWVTGLKVEPLADKAMSSSSSSQCQSGAIPQLSHCQKKMNEHQYHIYKYIFIINEYVKVTELVRDQAHSPVVHPSPGLGLRSCTCSVSSVRFLKLLKLCYVLIWWHLERTALKSTRQKKQRNQQTCKQSRRKCLDFKIQLCNFWTNSKKNRSLFEVVIDPDLRYIQLIIYCAWWWWWWWWKRRLPVLLNNWKPILCDLRK